MPSYGEWKHCGTSEYTVVVGGANLFLSRMSKNGLEKFAHVDVVRTCITRKRGLLRKMYGCCPPCFGIQGVLCAAQIFDHFLSYKVQTHFWGGFFYKRRILSKMRVEFTRSFRKIKLKKLKCRQGAVPQKLPNIPSDNLHVMKLRI